MDERDLSCDITFRDTFDLPLANHSDRLIALQRPLGGVESPKAEGNKNESLNNESFNEYSKQIEHNPDNQELIFKWHESVELEKGDYFSEMRISYLKFRYNKQKRNIKLILEKHHTTIHPNRVNYQKEFETLTPDLTTYLVPNFIGSLSQFTKVSSENDSTFITAPSFLFAMDRLHPKEFFYFDTNNPSDLNIQSTSLPKSSEESAFSI